MTIYEGKNSSNKTKPGNPATGPNKAQGLNLQDNRQSTTVQAKFANADRQNNTTQLNTKGSFVDNRPLQKRGNNTGLPDQLKAGVENLSGHSLDDVKVHYNSDKPGQLQAHAFAQGNQIHVAPGQEKHLPHEAWHVAQQKQGRVKPTLQMKTGIAVNDNHGLEQEADAMGAKAVQLKSNNTFGNNNSFSGASHAIQSPVVQRSIIASGGKMAKGPRKPFRSDINKYLEIGNNEARCHYIPFGYIRSIVMNQINSGLSGLSYTDVMVNLEFLIAAIFPNGGTAKKHLDNNFQQLDPIAKELYQTALVSLKSIGSILNSTKDLNQLAGEGTSLINALNNSPDNLRPGNSNTNSSISDAIDFPSDHVKKGVLNTGEIIVDKDYKPAFKLSKPKEVLIPNPESTKIILDLIDSAHMGFEAVAYSSDDLVQSSDHIGMKTATMSDTVKIPIALELATGWYLFETN